MLEQEYKAANKKKYLLLLSTAVIIVVLGLFFTAIGMKQGVMQVLIAVKLYFAGTLEGSPDTNINKIILLLRLPRIALAILAGIGLAVAGVVMQSITRNDLVSPFTLGISSAAAFGASLCIVFGNTLFFQSEAGIVTCAFIACLLCVAVIYTVAQKLGITPTAIVLVGIALNYFFSALTATVEFFAKEHKLEDVVQWTFGTFNRASWEHVAFTGGVVIVCFLLLQRYGLELDVLASNDDDMAKSLGIQPGRLRTKIGITAVLITAAIISFTGVIGFVGLIAPHMARILIGNEHKFLIPFSGLLGALLLLLADTFGKYILYPVSIPVGIVISFLGVPLFIHLILSGGKKGLE
ncbi:FecCD family ABC transporter permease [Sporomusa aerivorans]|uniref:FecCD family ABC transporter permease n=1 Tax=Sporomusa aerivorans TaxID=204936 RepID=UPI003529E3F0